MLKTLCLGLFVSAGLMLPGKVAAEEAGALFSARTVDQRTAALQALRNAPESPETQMALASWQAFGSLERFGQTLHAHGFHTPRIMFLPLMQMPILDNTGTPEVMTYAKWRATLTDLVAGLDKAKEMLEAIDDQAEIGLDVDLSKMRFDLNEDGVLSKDESVLKILLALDRSNLGRRTNAAGSSTPPPVFRFDRADGYWLQGYANFLTANARMWLAHDFEQTFDASFGLFFRGVGGAEDPTSPKKMGMYPILDAISLVHTINWPVVEPETRRSVRSDLLEMIRLSRLNWKAIRAETDNDREWLPGPQQTGPHPLTAMEVTNATVTAWHYALDLAEDLLNGKRLLSHLRYADKGINFERFFDDPQRFDLVLTITGPGTRPYLETGTLVDRKQWRQITRVFGRRGIMPYAIWFN